ncbi:unnamed protein product [Lymnaea stagnalis]|uniref:C1q domain-containing protein n=1 Tax=Lymnaea stagnalis TaxID=6523 RepID=A0AAV2H065_LYMST
MTSSKNALTACCVLALTLTVIALGSEEKRQTQVARPAFSAGLTSSLNVSDHVNVTYDRVFTNVGNVYDPQTGVFTVPLNGTYTILFHALAEYSGMLWLDLYRNSQYITSAYAHIEGQYGAASNSITITLAKGDEVYITGHGSSILYGNPNEVYATFTGYMLFS